MHYLIIGAGPAGLIAAETLRSHDPQGRITIVGDEAEPPYSRMALPYLLVGQIGEQGTYLRKQQGYYEQQRIELLQGRLSKLLPAEQQCQLADGRQISYDKLLIATGSSPVKPPIKGLDREGVYHCWNLADARNIQRLATEKSRVVLLGAGFIGCIILESLYRRGVTLDVVEMGNHMVPRMMNETAGTLLKEWCQDKGITVHTATSIEHVDGHGKALEIGLSDGRTLPADLLIIAAGVRPNIECIANSGLEIEHQGLLVNQYMQSSDADIYAAGDVACSKDFSTGGYSIQAIQPTAVAHGRLAALNMSGHPTAHRGCLNMNVLDVVGLISSSFGQWDGVDGGEQAEAVDRRRYRYLNLQFEGDRLIGASSLGRTEHIGILRGLIQGEHALGPWKEHLLQEPQRLMEAYLAVTGIRGYGHC